MECVILSAKQNLLSVKFFSKEIHIYLFFSLLNCTLLCVAFCLLHLKLAKKKMPKWRIALQRKIPRIYCYTKLSFLFVATQKRKKTHRIMIEWFCFIYAIHRCYEYQKEIAMDKKKLSRFFNQFFFSCSFATHNLRMVCVREKSFEEKTKDKIRLKHDLHTQKKKQKRKKERIIFVKS